jgi:hypothetical protein
MTTGVDLPKNDHRIDVDVPIKPSHGVSHHSHVSSNETMYDVQIDGKIMARDLSYADAQSYIRAQFSIEDAMAAILEVLIDPQFSFEDTLRILHRSNLLNLVSGAVLIKKNPANNSAPSPIATSASRASRGRKTARRMREFRSIETSINSVPREYLETHRGLAILDVDTLHVRYIGESSAVLEYVQQLLAQGIKKESLRPIYSDHLSIYIEDVKANGFSAFLRGHQICAGTKEEVRTYILEGVKTKRFTVKEISVRKGYVEAKNK